jgi:hypothetical protein
VHGHVLLEITGFFGHHGDSVERFLLPLVTKLATGIGTEPDHVPRCAGLVPAGGAKPKRAT